MEPLFLLKGLILGFSIAAPVGPIGILCIRRTLASGMGYGLISGLGAATADAVYGMIAAFGLSLLTQLLIDHSTYLQFGGSLFLFYLGYSIIRAQPATKPAEAQGNNYRMAYFSTLVLTLTNPMTILSFGAVFAGVGLIGGRDFADAASLVAGVFGGSALWWLVLSGTVHSVRSLVKGSVFLWINRLSGMIMLAFGLVTLLSLFKWV